MGVIGYNGAGLRPVSEDTEAHLRDEMLDASFFQAASAAFQDSGAVSTYASERDMSNRVESMLGTLSHDAGWQPYHSIVSLGPQYEEYFDDLANTKNKNDFDATVKDIDRLIKLREIQSSNSYAGQKGTLVGSLVSPEEIAISVGSLMAGSGQAMRLLGGATKKGSSTKRIADATKFSGGVGAVDVGLRSLSEPAFDGDDAMAIVGGSAMLGSLGGLTGATAYNLQRAGRIRKSKDFLRALEREQVKPEGKWNNTPQERIELLRESAFGKKIQDDEWDDILQESGGDHSRPKTLSAAALDAQEDANKLVDSKLYKMVKSWNYVAQNLDSSSQSARKITSQLIEHNFRTLSDAEGTPLTPEGAVSTRIKVQLAPLATAMDSTNQIYKSYRKRIATSNERPMTRSEFNKAAYLHLQKNSVEGQKLHSIPEVEKAATTWQKTVYEPSLKNALEVGLIKRGHEPSDYAPVFYKRNLVRDDMDGFTESIKRALSNGARDARDKLQRMGKDYKATEAEKNSASLQAGDLNDLARMYAQTIAGISDVPPADSDALNALSNRFKGRNHVLDYSQVADYIETDIETASQRYMRSVVPDIEMTREFGDISMKKQIAEMEDEFAAKIKKAGSFDEEQRIRKEMHQVVGNIEFLRDTLRNRDPYSLTTSVGVRNAIKAANTFAFTLQMGMFAVNALAETAIPIMVHGIKNSYGLLLKDMMNDFKGWKLSSKDAKLLNIANDSSMNERMLLFADSTGTSLGATDLELKGDKIMAGAAKIFGVPFFTDVARKASTFYNQEGFARDLPKLADWTADKFTREKYANLGIGQDEARVLMPFLKKHGEVVDNYIHTPNLEKWDGVNADYAKRVYTAALMKAVNNEILMPNVGDLPKFAQTPAGKLVMFMRSYQFTATHKLLPQLLDMRNPHAAMGLFSILSAGMLSYVAYESAAGRDIGEIDDLVIGGIDRSGILGLGWEANNILDRSFGIGLGDGEKIMPHTNFLEQIGGPTVSTIGDVAGFVADPEATKARYLTPMQNFVGTRLVERALEK